MAKLRGFLTGIVFAAIAVGFAWAVPASLQAPNEGRGAEKKAAHAQDDKPAKDDADGDSEEESEDPEESSGKPDDNHGAAVSTAAHCDVKGKAHGELVRSIAQDKDATVADAEAACAAALAAQPEDATHGKPDHAGTKAKGHEPGSASSAGGGAEHKPTKSGKPAKDDTEAEDGSAGSDDAGSEDGASSSSPGSSNAGGSSSSGGSSNAGGNGKSK